MLPYAQNAQTTESGGTNRFDWLILMYKMLIQLFVIPYALTQFVNQFGENEFSLNEIDNFLEGRPFEEDELTVTGTVGNVLYYGWQPLVVTAAVVLTIVMAYRYLKPQGHGHSHHLAEVSVDNPGLLQDLRDIKHRIWHVIERPLEIFGFANSFGLLDATSTYVISNVLQEIIGTEGRIALSVIAGLISTWGNYRFHDSILREEVHFKEIWSTLPIWKKVMVAWFTAAVFAGHFFEGFGIIRLFSGLFSPRTIPQKIIVNLYALFVGVLILAIEGLNESKKIIKDFSGDIKTSKKAKAITLIPAILHGLLPVLGFLTLLDAASQFILNKGIAQALTSFYTRLSVLLADGVAFGIGNIYGFYSLILPSVHEAMEDFIKFLYESENLRAIRHEISMMSTSARTAMSSRLDSILACFSREENDLSQRLVDVIKDLKAKLLFVGDTLTCGLLRNSVFAQHEEPLSRLMEEGAFDLSAEMGI